MFADVTLPGCEQCEPSRKDAGGFWGARWRQVWDDYRVSNHVINPPMIFAQDFILISYGCQDCCSAHSRCEDVQLRRETSAFGGLVVGVVHQPALHPRAMDPGDAIAAGGALRPTCPVWGAAPSTLVVQHSKLPRVMMMTHLAYTTRLHGPPYYAPWCNVVGGVWWECAVDMVFIITS